MARFESSVINEINNLSLDMIYKSDGIIGDLFNINTILYSLYAEELRYKNNSVNWINRDRVVFSSDKTPGLYSTLYMSGFPISVSDLKNYQQLNSNIAKYSNHTFNYGVDCITGKSNCVGMSVGICIAQRYLENLILKIKPKSKLLDFYTYLVCPYNHVLMGNSLEALNYAGKNSLNKLIVLMSITESDLSNEDLELLFESLNFNVLKVKNNGNTDRICEAIEQSKKSKKPSIILVVSKEEEEYQQKLTKEKYLELKSKFSASLSTFSPSEKIKDKYLHNIDDRVNKTYKKWLIEYEECRNLNDPNLNMILDLLENDSFNIEFDINNFKINDNYLEKLEISNEKILNVIANKTPFVLGTNLIDKDLLFKKFDIQTKSNLYGKNLDLYGKTNAFSDILNGISLLNIRTFANTLGNDINYFKSGLKISALNSLKVTYIINCKNDGIYTDIDEINSLKLVPDLVVVRPCDINEIIGMWEFNLKNSCPMVICIDDAKMQKYKNTNAKYVKYGAYMIKKERLRLDGVLIASGKNIELAMDISEELFQDGIDLRVVSMPSQELFLRQNPKYEEQLLPSDKKIFVIDDKEPLIWNRFASNHKCIFAVDKYINSESNQELLKELGLDKNTLKRKIKENI